MWSLEIWKESFGNKKKINKRKKLIVLLFGWKKKLQIEIVIKVFRSLKNII